MAMRDVLERKKKTNKVATIAVGFILCLFLTACEDVEWFVQPEPTELTGDSYGEIEEKTYYVKEGTKFYEVLTPKIQEMGVTVAKAEPSRVITVYEKESLLPKYYEDSFIVYKEKNKPLDKVVLERLYDRGWSIGVKRLFFDDRGYLTMSSTANLVENSSFGSQIKAAGLNEVRIMSINGEEVTPEMVDTDAGIILGLEKEKEYEIEIYYGTSYGKIKATADVHMLQSYEVYNFDNSYINFTQKDYMQFKLPQSMNPGYYVINGAGIFLYTGGQRGEEVDIDVNEKTENQFKVDASQAYSLLISTRMHNVEVVIKYDNAEPDVKGTLISPTGEEYSLTNNNEDNTLSVELDEAMAGEWQIKIFDATAKVSDISVNDTTSEEETTMELQTLVFDEDESNVTINVPVTFEVEKPNVYGYIFAPDGRVYDFELNQGQDKSSGQLTYTFPLITKGMYQLKIYYLVEETKVTSAEIIRNGENDTDVIHIGD